MSLVAADLAFAWREQPVLRGIDLALATGEVVALLGANGAGKSTLLRLLLGLLAPQAGQVSLDGKPLAAWRRRALARHLAYVPQVHATPFPYLVRDIALLGRLPAGGLFAGPSSEDHAIVDGVLAQLGISHLAARPYTEISGGERQLALIARALAQGARLLILDEPATGLDYGHQLRLLERLRRLADDGYGVLMSTHHPEHALIAARRALLLHDGRIEAAGPPREVITAASIGRLYGVPVLGIHARDGSIVAFRPDLEKAACPC